MSAERYCPLRNHYLAVVDNVDALGYGYLLAAAYDALEESLSSEGACADGNGSRCGDRDGAVADMDVDRVVLPNLSDDSLVVLFLIYAHPVEAGFIRVGDVGVGGPGVVAHGLVQDDVERLVEWP